MNNKYSIGPLLFSPSQSIEHGYNITSSGLFIHSKGYYTKAGILNAYSASISSPDVMTMSADYGNITASFASGYVYIYNEPFDSFYNRVIVPISRSYWDTNNTIVEILGNGIETDKAFTINLSTYPFPYEGDEIIPSLYSNVEGDNSLAIGIASHAEGGLAQAVGNISHAEGYNTVAIGIASHTEGHDSKAIGNWSHAEGYGTIAEGDFQHVQGQFNKSSSIQSAFIIGDGTNENNRKNLIFAANNEVQITGSLYINPSSIVLAAGTNHVLAYNNNTGEVTYTSSIGGGGGGTPSPSDTFIQYNSGSQFGATGSFRFIYTSQSLQQGNNVTASGLYSHAEGQETRADGLYSHAEGVGFLVNYGNAVDLENNGLNYFFADNIIGGSGVSIDIPNNQLVISGDASSQLFPITASGDKYFEDNNGNWIYLNTDYYGDLILENVVYDSMDDTTTYTFNNLEPVYYNVEGTGNRAIGSGSHTEGYYTKAIGIGSHAEGIGTISTGDYQHVAGRYNLTSSIEGAFIVGNGFGPDSRSNIMLVNTNNSYGNKLVQITGSAFITEAMTSSIAVASGSGLMPRFRAIGTGSVLMEAISNNVAAFAVIDGISDSILSVNGISGVPVLSVKADDTVHIGVPNALALHTSFYDITFANNTEVYKVLTSSYDALYLDYVIKSGSNSRAGQLISMWSGSEVSYTDISTTQFGDTSGFTWGAYISQSYMNVSSSATTTGWYIKSIIRSI